MREQATKGLWLCSPLEEIRETGRTVPSVSKRRWVMTDYTIGIQKQIRNINSYFYDLVTYEIRDTNLTAPQVLVLRCIKGQPQMVSQISERIRLSNSTVSGIIDRLEKMGYVKRIRDPKDRRIVWVTETEKLIELREELPVLQDGFFDFLLEDIDTTRVEEIYRSLEALANHMHHKLAIRKND